VALTTNGVLMNNLKTVHRIVSSLVMWYFLLTWNKLAVNQNEESNEIKLKFLKSNYGNKSADDILVFVV